MNAQEIKATLAEIARMKWDLETALEENGGELTPELLERMDALEGLKALLAGDGIDDLGRWLKSVQDEAAARKAEADAAERKVKNLKSYEDYVKFLIVQAMDALDLKTNDKGEKVARGSFYGFKRTTSTKSSVNQDALDEKYLEKAEKAIRKAKVPAYISVSLKTTTTALREADALEFLEETTTPALGFTKPRANQKKED